MLPFTEAVSYIYVGRSLMLHVSNLNMVLCQHFETTEQESDQLITRHSQILELAKWDLCEMTVGVANLEQCGWSGNSFRSVVQVCAA